MNSVQEPFLERSIFIDIISSLFIKSTEQRFLTLVYLS